MMHKNIYSVDKIENEESNTFNIFLNGGWDYIKVTHNTAKGRGWIGIISTFGDYAYYWNAMGENTTLPEFFIRANNDYIASKLLPDNTYFNVELAIKELKELAIKDRKTGYISKELARDVIDFIDNELVGNDLSKDIFGERMYNSDVINRWYPEWWDSKIGMDLSGKYLVLRDEIIPMIREHFKKTLIMTTHRMVRK